MADTWLPVTVLSGCPGAGKPTLQNRALKSREGRRANMTRRQIKTAAIGLGVADDPAALDTFLKPGCAAAIWPVDPPAGLLHRSPPNKGTGETHLVLMLDPIFDPEDAA